MERNNHYFFILILCCFASIYLSAQKSNQPNLLDAQYRVINSEKYPMMTSDMKGFDIDLNNFVFIDLTYYSIFRGLVQCGYEKKINAKHTVALLFGITFLTDPLTLGFNTTDDVFIKKKSKLANAIHEQTWDIAAIPKPYKPGIVLGLEHSYGFNEDVLHGFSLKSGCMYYNSNANLSQNLFVLYDNNKTFKIETEQSIRIDQYQIYGGLSYKKVIKQGVFFDGGVNLGFKMIRYGIKVSPILDVYKINPISIKDPNEVYYTNIVPSNEAFISNPDGKIPYQFTPTILLHGRIGFGFNKRKKIWR